MKRVLLKCLENNKVITLPEKKDESDVMYLKNQARKLFSYENHVVINITLQRFDADWKAYIDLDDDDEVCNKDTLKIVATPLLSTPTTSERSSEKDSSYNSLYDTQKSRHCNTFDDDSDEDVLVKCKHKLSSLTTDFDDEQSSHSELSGSTPARKKKVISKGFDDTVPLPKPFPLPKHYRNDVEVALKAKKMTRETRSTFLSTVASSMLSYKRYPTSTDYVNVAHSILTDYDFLKSPVGTPDGAMIESLKNRFKEFRRERKPRCETNSISTRKETKSKVLSPGTASLFTLPSIPEGEDAVSYQKHIKVLQMEFKKTRPNSQIVDELMNVTFATRRKDVTENNYDLKTIFDKYPFLQLENELLKDLQRICGNNMLLSIGERKWEDLYEKAFEQAMLDATHSRNIKKIVHSIPDNINDPLFNLMILPHLLPDSKSKADFEKVIYFTKGASEIEKVVKEKGQPQAYILVIGDITEYRQCFLITDCRILFEIKKVNIIPLLLLATYFGYNIQYPNGCVEFNNINFT